MAAVEMLNFVAFGLPSPGGSKSAFRNPRTGKIVVVDAGGKKTRTWRTVVAHAARAAMSGGELMQPPLALVIEFRMPRPKAHYESEAARSNRMRRGFRSFDQTPQNFCARLKMR